MKIIILGAGQVGSSLAAALVGENNDISVVDTDGTRLAALAERLDIRTVHGHASLPSTLGQAGAEDAELVIAVTSSDEVNLVACQVADIVYKTPSKIARLREAEYLQHPELTGKARAAVDVAISPEDLVCRHVQWLVEYPGALQVLDFADGRAQLVGVRAETGGALVGHEIRELRAHLPAGVDTRVAAIFRHGRALLPTASTRVEPGDEVFFLAESRHVRTVMAELRRAEQPARRVFIAGGGNIGHRLAKALKGRFSVKVLERSRAPARRIAEDLDAIVLVGDCSDEDLLREENIDSTDIYCALTNDDEANILSAMLAKRMGCQRVVALINRPAYAELVEGDSSIDIAVSPQQVTLGALLTSIRQGSMVKVHSLRRGMAEAIEAVALGDRRTSRVIGRSLEELQLPDGATIGGLVRGDALLIAHHDVVIEANDHIIVFLADKRQLKRVQSLFRTDATWF